jgi:transposase
MTRNNARNEINGTAGAKASLIKLGLDVHADSIVVVRQIDTAPPQPAQRMSPEQFERFAARQCRLATRVVSCYEAGPFGFALHRSLAALGIENLVVRPCNWDEQHRRVKTDKTDAAALLNNLDRWLCGNRRALWPVAVPEPAQELARASGRMREQVRRTRQRLEAQGRTLMLYFGHRFKGHWWAPRRWEPIAAKLPGPLRQMVGQLRQLVLATDGQLRQMTEALERADTPAPEIKGLGALTNQLISREMLDWHRFKNRRAVAGITGLCPSVWSTGTTRRQGPITKCGRPRLRRALIEAAWRLVEYQPGYAPVARWSPLMAGGTPSLRKKAIVAIARHFAVDLWRIRTGRATPAKLGLIGG